MEKEQVNHPSHYAHGKIECIDAMQSAKGVFKTIAFCECSTFKYNWRQGMKDATIQEIQKQTWYNSHQIELLKKIDANEKAKSIYNKLNKLCNELDELLCD